MIDLIIFTCEGREHLLQKTVQSFTKTCNYPFKKVILAIDGNVDPAIISEINADVTIQYNTRHGYVNSIANALKLVDAPYFFWLEDDFLFNKEIPLTMMLDTLIKQPKWASIFLSRTILLPDETKHHHFDEFYIPNFGFSVSPSICNTVHIKTTFNALESFSKSSDTKHYGFEPFMDDYFLKNNLSYATIDPGAVPHVTHAGQLESTAREYHMINSIDKKHSLVNKLYISGFGKDKKIILYNKLTMLPKLWLSVFVLTFEVLFNRQAYDFAFRIYLAYLRKFKY